MQEMIHGAGILEEFLNHVGGLHKQGLESSNFDSTTEAPARAVTGSSLDSNLYVSNENKFRVAETEGAAKIELLSQASTFSVPIHSLDSSEVHLTLTTLGSGNLVEEAKPQSSLAALVRATESSSKTSRNGFHCRRSELSSRVSEDDDNLEDDEGDESGDDRSSSEEDIAPAKPPQESSSIDVNGQFFQWFVMHHRRCNAGIVLKLKTVYDNFKNTNLWLGLPKSSRFTYVRFCELFEQHATLGVDYRARSQRSLGFLRDVLVGWELHEPPIGGEPIEMQDMISALLQLSEPTDSDSASDPATTMLTLITVAEGKSDGIKPRKKTRSENLVYQRWNEDRKVKKGLPSRSNSHSPVPLKSSETLSSPSCMSDFKFPSSSSATEGLPVEVVEILEEAQLSLVVQKWRKDRKERGVYWVYDRDSKYKFDTITGTASLCAASIEHVVFGPKRTLTGVELPASPARKRSGSIGGEASSSPSVRRSVSMTDLKHVETADKGQTITKAGYDSILTFSRRGLQSGYAVSSSCESLNTSGDSNHSKSGRRTRLKNASEPLPDVVSKLLCQAQLLPEAQGWHEDSHSKGTYWLRKLEGRYKVNTKAGSVWYWPPHSRKHNVVFQEPSGRDIFSNESLISSSLCSKSTISSDTTESVDSSDFNGPKKKRAEHRRKGVKSETLVEDHVDSMHVTNGTKNVHGEFDPAGELSESPSQRKRVSRRTKSADGNDGSPSELLNSYPPKRKEQPSHSPKRRTARKRNEQVSDAAISTEIPSTMTQDSSVDIMKQEPPVADNFPIQAGVQRWSSRLHGGLVETHTELPRRAKQRKVSRARTNSPEIGGSIVPPGETSGPASKDIQVSPNSCSDTGSLLPIESPAHVKGKPDSVLISVKSILSERQLEGISSQPNIDGIAITAPVATEAPIEQKGSQIIDDLPPLLDSADLLSMIAATGVAIDLSLAIDPVQSELTSITDSAIGSNPTIATDSTIAIDSTIYAGLHLAAATNTLPVAPAKESSGLKESEIRGLGAACEFTRLAVEIMISHETDVAEAPVRGADSPSLLAPSNHNDLPNSLSQSILLPVARTPSILATPNLVVQAPINPPSNLVPCPVNLSSQDILSPLSTVTTSFSAVGTPNILMDDSCRSVLPMEIQSAKVDLPTSCSIAETVQISGSPSQNVSYAEEPSLILAPLEQAIDLPNLSSQNTSLVVQTPSVLAASASITTQLQNAIQASTALSAPSSLQVRPSSLSVAEPANLSQNISLSAVSGEIPNLSSQTVKEASVLAISSALAHIPDSPPHNISCLVEVPPLNLAPFDLPNLLSQTTPPSLVVEIPSVLAVPTSPVPVINLPTENTSLLVEAPVLDVSSLHETPERLLLQETFPGEILGVPNPGIEVPDFSDSLLSQDISTLLDSSDVALPVTGAALEEDNIGASQIFTSVSEFQEEVYREHTAEDISFVETQIDESGSTDSNVRPAMPEESLQQSPVDDEAPPDLSENFSTSASQMLDGRRRRRRTRPVVLAAPSWMVKNTTTDSQVQQDFEGSEIEAIFDVLEQRDNSKLPAKTNPRPELEQSTHICKVDESLSPRAVGKMSARGLVEANTGNRRVPPLTKVRPMRREHVDHVPPHKETSIQNLHKPARAVPPSSYVCKLCKVAGHWMEGCSRYICASCKRPGHSTVTCPDRGFVDNNSRDATETLRNTSRHDDGLRMEVSSAPAQRRHERTETHRDHGQSRSANFSSGGCAPIEVRSFSRGASLKPNVSSPKLDRMPFDKKRKSASRSRDEPRILSDVRHSMDRPAIRPKDEPRTYSSNHDAREHGRSSSRSRDELRTYSSNYDSRSAEQPASRFTDEARAHPARYDARGQSIGSFKNEARAPVTNNYDARGLKATKSASRPRDETRVRTSNYDSRLDKLSPRDDSRVHSNPATTRTSDKSTTGFSRAHSSAYDTRGPTLDTATNGSKMESRRPALDQSGGLCESRIHSNYDARGFGLERTSSGVKDESRTQSSTFDARVPTLPTLDRKRSRSLSGSETSSSRVDPKRLQGTNHDRNSTQRRSIGNPEDVRRNEEARYASGSFQRGTDIRDSNAGTREQIPQRFSHVNSNFQSVPPKRTHSDPRNPRPSNDMFSLKQTSARP